MYLKSESSFSHLTKPAKKLDYFFFYSHRSHRYVNRFSLFPLSFPHFVPSANEKKKKKSEPKIISTVEMLLFTSLVVDKLLCLCEYTIYALLLTYAQKPINGNKQMRRRQRRKSWMKIHGCVCVWEQNIFELKTNQCAWIEIQLCDYWNYNEFHIR